MDGLLAPVAALALGWLTAQILRGGFSLKPGQRATNISGHAFFLAALSVLAAMLVFGWIVGLIIVLGIAIHEFGHVAAYRAMGHEDARFRLIPLLGGVAISGKLPRNQLSDFYVSFMGPGIMLWIVALTMALAGPVAEMNPYVGLVLAQTAIITGSINFFNLLPLWPLDGGRILRTLTYHWSPLASRYLTLAMSIGLAIWSLYVGAPLILLVAILGFGSARKIAVINRAQPPMDASQSLTASGAYICALAAHGIAGWPLIAQLVFRS